MQQAAELLVEDALIEVEEPARQVARRATPDDEHAA